jgi:hypothetical protein
MIDIKTLIESLKQDKEFYEIYENRLYKRNFIKYCEFNVVEEYLWNNSIGRIYLKNCFLTSEEAIEEREK